MVLAIILGLILVTLLVAAVVFWRGTAGLVLVWRSLWLMLVKS